MPDVADGDEDEDEDGGRVVVVGDWTGMRSVRHLIGANLAKMLQVGWLLLCCAAAGRCGGGGELVGAGMDW